MLYNNYPLSRRRKIGVPVASTAVAGLSEGPPVRPISLLRLSLLRLLDSDFPGNSLMGLGIPPLKLKILLESNPLISRILVRSLAVPASLLRPISALRFWISEGLTEA